MLEQTSSEKLQILLVQQKEALKQELSIMYPYLIVERRVRPRLSNKMKKAILHQFQVNDVKRFIELTKEDLYAEDKILIQSLDLFEHGYRVPRIEKYVGTTFGYNELILNLLLLNEMGLDLYKAKIILSHDNFQKLLNTMPYEPVYINSVLHIYDIPVLTDYNREPKHRCVPTNLFIVTCEQSEAKVYEDEIKVTCLEEINNLPIIDSYRSMVPDLRPSKFYTIKI